MRNTTSLGDRELAYAIAREVALRGGRTYYVGGCVRDRLLGLSGKDVDIEVHGMPVDQLEGLLAGLGEVVAVGASFGVYNLRGHTLDIAVPRREDAGTRGGKDELAEVVDPFVGTRSAARRRDLTMNALYEDVLTGEVVDHVGGRADLASGVIRHVDDETFVQDPLRVLRAAQFAARLGMVVDVGTVRLCSGIDLSGLPSERVLEELRKALTRSRRPSVFFETLRDMGRLEPWFAEVAALVGVPQNPVYHPEGDVWNHTMLVLDVAAGLRDRASEPFGLMLSALCHDLGKAVTIEERDGRLISYGHEVAGLPLARALLDRLGVSLKTRSYVLNMVELHMAPNSYVGQRARAKAYFRLFDRSVCPRDLLLLARADDLGRGGREPGAGDTVTGAAGDGVGGSMTGAPGDGAGGGMTGAAGSDAQGGVERELEGRLRDFEELMARPYVQGRDLIEAGMEPGPLMGEVLRHAHKLRLAGLSKDVQLRQSLGYWRGLQRGR